MNASSNVAPITDADRPIPYTLVEPDLDQTFTLTELGMQVTEPETAERRAQGF